MCEKTKRLVVGVSGASGMPILLELLRALRPTPIETHLVVSRGGEMTLLQETGLPLSALQALADVTYDDRDLGAAIASGSFATLGMLVAPCSMKTLAGIHGGYSDSLLLRAADVTLKEQRRLVLCARECPLSPIHLRNMYELATLGVTILPPMLSYYNKPQTVQDMTAQIVGKLLERFGVAYAPFRRWEGMDHEA